ncbi:Ig-like domain-containing protein [Phaeobacter gallaeciensis]|uniref:Ig-like domain-containing protein n=2 Tax=Phaeobacter gallaeciensis TaxID=60890 RepID=UPI00237F8DBE|nr:Ig-like domain-containing protein [Phaeobacter gallaeciensis]MDE4110852.1 Ig-like domain-containing protein [Phaeobacter gallaeciensis]
MSSVGYISRDMTGTTVQGVFAEGTPAHLNVSQTKDISLNLGRSAVESYARHGADLHIVLADGQTLVLDNFFSYGATGGKNLFLSADGQFIEVVLEDKADGMLFASYETLDLSGKWSAYDELVFLDVDRIEPVIAPLAAPLLGGFGAAGVAAAGVVGTAVLVTDDSETGTPPGRGRVPTVDDPDAVYPIAGSTNDPVVITGTGTPGSEVRVLIGGHTETVTIRDDGTWTATIAINDLPPDGNYDTTVEVTDPDGNDFNLDGPTVIIDTTPPEAEVTSGTQSTGDVVNAIEQADGPVITGNGEPGARLNVRINNVTQRTTVNEDGTWSVTFDPADIPTGEYETAVRIRTTDEFGNRNTYHDVLVVDTIAPPIGIDTVEGDDSINFIEASDGVRLTGTGEAGASISVDFQGVTRTTTVLNNGTWSVQYGSGKIADGIYDSTISVTSSDAAGNSATETHTVHIDTENRVTINTQVGDDHTINAAEQAAGVTLTGMADPGATVVVTFEGISHTVTASADGSWSSAFSTAEIGTGTYDATVSAVATDTTGNVSTVTETIGVDTEISATLDAQQTGDNMLSAAEVANGFALTGTADANATVEVTLEGVTRTVTADANGNWQADFAGNELSAGEYDATISVTATDTAGNSTTTTGSLRVDTATSVTIDSNQVGGDDVINAPEAAAGVSLTGTAEAGASVAVTFQGATRTVTADGTGAWSADFAASEITGGEYDAPVTAVATDAAGNTASASSTLHIDTETSVTLNTARAKSDGILNAEEIADGVTLSGSAEAGASVAVTFQGQTKTVVADADGQWSVDYTPSEIAGGEYDAPISATATDIYGNTASATGTLRIDTETAVTIDPGQAGGDNIVNAAEAEAGVTLTGVAEPGSEVSVTLAGITRAAVLDASGNWSATFEAGAIAPGEYDSAVTVAATDAAGNTASASSVLRVDTVAGTVTLSPDPVELDDIINATERADGVDISGTATPGLLVTVGLGTASNQVVADVNGNWSTTFLAGQIPQGNAELPITASIVDSAGNTASATDTVALDTLVDPLTVAPDQTADDIINLAERAAGVTLQGTVEQGSTVQVTIAGVTHAATVDATGNWSADIAAADLPEGDYTATATITATDGAGNVQSLTESFTVDTSYTTPDVDAVTFSSSDVRRISTEGATDSYTVNALNSDGSVTAPTASLDQDPVFGTEFTFSTPVSDGTHLVITSEDSAQNASSTLVVLEDNATNSGALDHAGLPQFNIDALNLDYASDVSLSLTEADIKALSGNSDTLTVHGGADDTLTVANASAAGVEAVDGQIYNVYTVGDDGTKLLVDQDVNVLI